VGAAQSSEGKTIFRAQINVDKKASYNPTNPELSNNLITTLIRELHSKNN